jgi:membrane protease YdiL (CAAX protease family)
MGPLWAVAITAALWAIIHQQYDAYDIGVIFVMGLLIGAARVRTGSIYVPIAMHSVASLIATIEAAALAQ